MCQIQVNTPSVLLLLAVKSQLCLWREESVCGYKAYSQPCAVSTVQSARPPDSGPWGYRLLKWSSVPSITSLYYLRIQGKGNKLFIEPLRGSYTVLGKWLRHVTEITVQHTFCGYIFIGNCLIGASTFSNTLEFSYRCIQLLVKAWMKSKDK